MRTNIIHPGADKLHYEIRAIVSLAKQIEDLGMQITWENIGDPIHKGEKVPLWIREKIKNDLDNQESFAYSPTQGVESTRVYIANERNMESGIKICSDDILFFNGLGDAIETLYSRLHPSARVIGPDPAYPTHSSAEAAHANAYPITYHLDPEKSWEPDLQDLEQKIKLHSEIVGILTINPDNPTGFIYPQKTLHKIVALARKYNLFIISDEVYSNLAYDTKNMKKLASVIEDVPGIAMRGISKEFPWPGARCGWIEFYNRDKDKNFDDYVRSLINAKMLEVCSTTLPQRVIPEIMSDKRYHPYLEERIKTYSSKSKLACSILSEVPELIAHPAQGAFYITVVFRDGVLRDTQSLPLTSNAHKVIAPHLISASLDQRFAYELLAHTGICVVPLSTGFNSRLYGFRFTLLEPDTVLFEKNMRIIATSIKNYLRSTPQNLKSK